MGRIGQAQLDHRGWGTLGAVDIGKVGAADFYNFTFSPLTGGGKCDIICICYVGIGFVCMVRMRLGPNKIRT